MRKIEYIIFYKMGEVCYICHDDVGDLFKSCDCNMSVHRKCLIMWYKENNSESCTICNKNYIKEGFNKKFIIATCLFGLPAALIKWYTFIFCWDLDSILVKIVLLCMTLNMVLVEFNYYFEMFIILVNLLLRLPLFYQISNILMIIFRTEIKSMFMIYLIIFYKCMENITNNVYINIITSLIYSSCFYVFIICDGGKYIKNNLYKIYTLF